MDGWLSYIASTASDGAKTDVLGDRLAPFLLVLGVAMLGVFLMRAVRGKQAKREAEALSAKERIEAARSGGGSRGGAGASPGSPARLMASSQGPGLRSGMAVRETLHAEESRLLETAQRLASQLDAKTERLEQLMARAEMVAARLEEASRTILSDSGADGASDGGKSTQNRDAAGGHSTANGAAKDHEAHQAPSSEPSGRNDRRPSRRGSAARGPRLDPLTAEIYRRADAGEDAVAIAQAMDEQIGKVELILALRQPGAGA